MKDDVLVLPSLPTGKSCGKTLLLNNSISSFMEDDREKSVRETVANLKQRTSVWQRVGSNIELENIELKKRRLNEQLRLSTTLTRNVSLIGETKNKKKKRKRYNGKDSTELKNISINSEELERIKEKYTNFLNWVEERKALINNPLNSSLLSHLPASPSYQHQSKEQNSRSTALPNKYVACSSEEKFTLNHFNTLDSNRLRRHKSELSHRHDNEEKSTSNHQPFLQFPHLNKYNNCCENSENNGRDPERKFSGNVTNQYHSKRYIRSPQNKSVGKRQMLKYPNLLTSQITYSKYQEEKLRKKNSSDDSTSLNVDNHVTHPPKQLISPSISLLSNLSKFSDSTTLSPDSLVDNYLAKDSPNISINSISSINSSNSNNRNNNNNISMTSVENSFKNLQLDSQQLDRQSELILQKYQTNDKLTKTNSPRKTKDETNIPRYARPLNRSVRPHPTDSNIRAKSKTNDFRSSSKTNSRSDKKLTNNKVIIRKNKKNKKEIKTIPSETELRKPLKSILRKSTCNEETFSQQNDSPIILNHSFNTTQDIQLRKRVQFDELIPNEKKWNITCVESTFS
ncbi:hypothetical protein SNEBB_002401 [Seison nebaliae]|nr:hypothetical protein SNEBB_002401 [Seison nebaliae]